MNPEQTHEDIVKELAGRVHMIRQPIRENLPL